MELVVRARGNSPAEIEETLTDALALIQQGFTEVNAFDDPEGKLEMTLTGEQESVWCEAHGNYTEPHFEQPDCVYPHFTDDRTRARMNGTLP